MNNDLTLILYDYLQSIDYGITLFIQRDTHVPPRKQIFMMYSAVSNIAITTENNVQGIIQT